MSKQAFSVNLNTWLKRTATKQERRRAWAAYNLLGRERVSTIPFDWYLNKVQ